MHRTALNRPIFSHPSSYLEELRRLLDGLDPASIEQAAIGIESTWKGGGKILVLGNGGSAVTASHFVNDLVASCPPETGRPGLQAICLTDNPALVTAVSNDHGFDEAFLRPLRVYARQGDMVVAISGSGQSPNVVRAVRWACRNGLQVVALTGFDGGELAQLAHFHLHLPSEHYGPIEDVHLAVAHMICETLRHRLAEDLRATS